MGQLLTQDSRACTVSGPATTLNDRPKSAYPEVFRINSVCSPNANVPAVHYRASMLLLSQVSEPPDAVQQPIVELPDGVFEVAATFPMRRMPVGVPQQGLPFDVEEFAKQRLGWAGSNARDYLPDSSRALSS